MSSSDKIIEGFPHSTITPIVGQPYFETQKGTETIPQNQRCLHQQSPRQCRLRPIMANHLQHRLQHFVPRRVCPASKPRAYPHHPSGCNHPSNQCVHGHTQKGSKKNQEFNNTDKALKQQLLGAVDNMFTWDLKNRYIGYENVTTNNCSLTCSPYMENFQERISVSTTPG